MWADLEGMSGGPDSGNVLPVPYASHPESTRAAEPKAESPTPKPKPEPKAFVG